MPKGLYWHDTVIAKAHDFCIYKYVNVYQSRTQRKVSKVLSLCHLNIIKKNNGKKCNRKINMKGFYFV